MLLLCYHIKTTKEEGYICWAPCCSQFHDWEVDMQIKGYQQHKICAEPHLQKKEMIGFLGGAVAVPPLANVQ
uniref:Uncharacterized protein n=1 Tax=Romanomermis culicivorax TaxID=13658 RepID=A0A915L1V8_ROMCU